MESLSDYFLTLSEREARHARLIVEARNAIDEATSVSNGSNIHVLEDGRTLSDAKWEDAEGMRCCLKAMSKQFDKDITLANQLRTDYFLSRETSMPHQANHQYFFTTIRPVGELCDESKVGVPNQNPTDDIKYMDMALASLYARPTRQEVTPIVRTAALEYAILDEEVQEKIALIEGESGGVMAPVTINTVLRLVLKNEPLVIEEEAKVRIESEFFRTRIVGA